MAILVKIGDAALEDEAPSESPQPSKSVSIELNARKTLDGNLIIFDHADIDIVIMAKNNKVVSFTKDLMNDYAYGAQNRLFNYLGKKGVISIDSVQGGNIYGSMEAKLVENDSASKYALLNIHKFINEERPYFDFVGAYLEADEDQKVEPDDLHSTDLGDVPHADTKGTLRPNYVKDPYGLSSLYKI